jgi:hypothetical protein
MNKNKKIIFTSAMILILIIFLFLLEGISRAVIGNRLIVKVEDNGVYHFKENQEGWYSHRLNFPHARINNVGARGEDTDIYIEEDPKRYGFFGDSFTFGWAVKDEETIPSYFMKNMGLSSSEVLNFGNGGFGVEHMIEMYNLKEGTFTSGDTIIFIIVEGDFYRALVPYRSSWIKEFSWKIREKSSLISFGWAVFRHLTGEPAPAIEKKSEDENVFSEYGQELVEFSKLMKEKKRNIAYVFYEYDYTDYSRNAMNFCRENKLNCLTDVPYLIEKVKNDGKEIFAVDGAHPSSFANQEVAERLTSFINYHNL